MVLRTYESNLRVVDAGNSIASSGFLKQSWRTLRLYVSYKYHYGYREH